MRLNGVAAALLLLMVGCRGSGEEQKGQIPINDTTKVPIHHEVANTYGLSASQQDALWSILTYDSTWRIGEDSDNTSQLLARMKKDFPGYRPYYLKADLDKDGIEDYAIALTKEGRFKVIWFHGKPNGYADGERLATMDWLSKGGLMLKDGDLVAGSFYSDQIVTFKWDAQAKDISKQALDPDAE